MIGRASGVLLAAMACLTAGPPKPAVAQGFFESLFGIHQQPRYYNHQPRYVRPEPLPPNVTSYADPHAVNGREHRRHYGESGSTGGRGGTFCVRTCDGRYFPMQRLAGATPTELCRSFCPASKTMVFSGGKIDYAVAPNGMRYADLDNAFAYRDRLVENCTCNGKDGLGLAQLSTMADPTLRPGDIVATEEGLVKFRGKSSKNAAFSPIEPSSSAWARRLSEIKIRPAPPSAAVEIAPPADEEAAAPGRNQRRRAQLAR
jgi:hypothetical protein